MCSIMGVCGSGYIKDFTKAQFEECFGRTLSRGPDMSRVIETESGLLAFHRLAIMDLSETGMQPFERDGNALVCNGEIYGFRKIKNWKKNTGSAAIRIVKFSFRCTRNTD